jgi:glycosyltransferase involved in cell wall biosynthesis
MAKNGDCEGLPTVILEGINHQTPIIATNHAGIPEIIKDKQTGFICKENNEDELVTTILKFLSYGNTKEIIFNAKKELSLHFDAIKQSEKLQNLFINND